MGSEEFEDFSFASPWEKFSGAIEQVLRGWSSEDSSGEGNTEKDLATVVELKYRLPFRREPYLLKLYVKGTKGYPLQDSPRAGDRNQSYSTNNESETREYGTDDTSLEANSQDENLNEVSTVGLNTDIGEEESDEDKEGEDQEEEDDREFPGSRSVIKLESIKTSNIQGDMFVDSSEYFLGSAHKIQRWFGVRRFAVLIPSSATCRILDPQEAATVLSAVSVALSNVNTVLPVFIPVHDKYRDGMQGIAILNGRTVHFETDSSQTSQRPDYLRCVQGQLHILSHKLEPYSIDAAKLCSILSEGEEIGDSHKRNSVHTSFHVAVSSCVAYQVPVPVLKWSRTASAIGAEMEMNAADRSAVWKETWEEGCVWQPWASEIDPIEGLEVDIIWRDADLTIDHPLPHLTARNTDEWRIHVLSAERPAKSRWSIFTSNDSFLRQHLSLPCVADILSEKEKGAGISSRKWTLSARLHQLLQCLDQVVEARAVSDLLSRDYWEDEPSGIPDIPPEDVLMKSINDMFGDEKDHQPAYMTDHVEYQDSCSSFSTSPLFRWVPFHCLFGRLAMHAVVYRNPRAVSWLWTHFVRDIRVQHWEPLKELPLMERTGAEKKRLLVTSAAAKQVISDVLKQRTLQEGGIVSSAISRLPERVSWNGSVLASSDYESCEGDWDPIDPDMRDIESTDVSTTTATAAAEEPEVAGSHAAADTRPPEEKDFESPCGIASVMKGQKLLNRKEDICIPLTQPAPLYTADTLAHQCSTLTALQEAPGGSERASRMQAQVLLSDMASFKAANPGSVLEDFVRWHSPKDWIVDDTGAGRLSDRMSRVDNRWETYWKEVSPCPAAQQTPLMDPLVEGERAMHYLETIPPSELFEQLIPAGFIGALGCLLRAPCTSIPPVHDALEKFHDFLGDWDPEETSLSNREEIFPFFELIEKVVVLGEALSRRLERCPNTVRHILEMLLSSNNEGEEFAQDEKDGVQIADDEKQQIMRLLGGDKTQSSWGSAIEHEWVVKCESGGEGENGQQHRIYVKDAVGELRVATVVAAGS